MKKTLFVLAFIAGFSASAQNEIKTSLFGDIRVRHEANEEEKSTGKDNYDHLRLRARLGVKAQFNEQLTSEFRLATGEGGTSTNQTFSGTRNYDFKLDRAFLKYALNENTFLRAGRTDNPFVLVGENNMLFDSDLNLDGVSLSYTHKTELMSYQLILAHSILREYSNSGGTVDSKLNSAELAIRYAGDVQSLMLTIAEHMFSNLKNTATIVGFLGNSSTGTGAAGRYNYNYDVTAIGLEYGYKASIPITLFIEGANNNKASKDDAALIYGIRLNKVKKQGDWSMSVDSREVESDATLASLTDSDSMMGGTNGRSVNTSIGYGLDDNSNLMATYYMGEKNIASGQTKVDRNRLHVDLSVRF